MTPQVSASHYTCPAYLTKRRWCSLWHQLDEIQGAKPERVLEIGPGPGVLKTLATLSGLTLDTFDTDPELHPDCVGRATALPFADRSYDVVCAFQVLEHLPYDQSLIALEEMARVSQRIVLLSLPDARKGWLYQLHFPLFGKRQYILETPRLLARPHRFDGQHYWEVNKRGYSLDRIIRDFSQVARLLRTYRVPEYLYHRFFVLARQ